VIPLEKDSDHFYYVMTQLNELQFQKFRALIFDNCGIQPKKEMIEGKLDKLLRKNNLSSYDEFYQLLSTGANSVLWSEFIDEITVHMSSFFRENNHFEFMRSQLRLIFEKNPRILKNNEIKLWSAGCSTGEEPYTLAMVLKEWLPQDMTIKILATDISKRTMASAQRGIYPATIKKEMDPYYLMQYFNRSEEDYEIKPELKALITFRLFNLMDSFPFQDTFDIIFCRNVMIYFNAEIQQKLVQKFRAVLTMGGLLFIGHSESLLNKQNGFQYMQPTVYLNQGK
jgi:chemotaxis protein methyltransferase CheR